MSLNRENVIWQSEDGTWNRGFYDFHYVGERDEDFDEEWDVEYTEKLSWVSTGHASRQLADSSWRGPNPGGSSEISYSEENREYIEELEDEAAKTYLAAQRGGHYASGYSRGVSYQGPPKKRKPEKVAKDLYDAKIEAVRLEYGGYGNSPHPLIPTWEKEVETAAQSRALDDARAQYKKKLEDFVSEEEEKNRKYGYFTSTHEDRQRNYRRSEILQRVKNEVKQLSVPSRKQPEPSKSTHVDIDTPNQPAATTSSKSDKGTYGKYHINPTTGRPNKCYATKKACPFGGGDSHYESKTEARAGYEKKMEDSTVPAAQRRQ